jgi:predicted dehydrogenase
LWAGLWRVECGGGEICWTSRDNLGATNRAAADRVTIRPLGQGARRVELPVLPHIDQAGSLAAFARAIRSGEEPESSGRDNLGSVALMLAAVESAASGLPVPVPQVLV